MNAEAERDPSRGLRLGRTLRVLAPSLATLVLITLLVFTIFFTALDWQWIAFLSGTLCAAVLSLVSASWKSTWRMGRRTAEVARFKALHGAERDQHRHTRDMLEQLQRNAESLKAAAVATRGAAGLLGTLEHELTEIAFVVDRDLRYLFHTRGYAAWAQAQPVRIAGHLLDEPLRPQVADALKAPLAEALYGRLGRVELATAGPGGVEKRFEVTFVPHYGRPREVTGALVRFAEIEEGPVAAATRAAPDGEGGNRGSNATYVDSLTAELTGWDDPRARIRDAIERDEFDLHVQDIVALRDGTVPARMHEVLIRMRDEETNLIPPGAFLPVAERCGLMVEIDRYVVQKVIAAQNATRGRRPLMCINLSRPTLQDGAFAAYVASALSSAAVAADSLCFEFEDSDVLAVVEDASRLARDLREIGCRRTLDGFGAAGVSFNHLATVPVNYLKIDGRIVFEMARDPVALAKINAIQRVCRAIGVGTIAELVEHESTVAELRKLGVDYAQGFGVAQPRAIGPAIRQAVH